MNDSSFMVSDSLAGVLPDDQPDDRSDDDLYVRVVAIRPPRRGDPFVGLLRGVLVDERPEVELKVELGEALSVAGGSPEEFEAFQFHHAGAVAFELRGPFVVGACRVQDVDVATQTCVLSLLLERC